MADTVNIYEFRTMLAALEQRVPPRTFLLDTFFNSEEVHDTEAVDIDIVQGKRKLAPFVNPRLPGKTVERRGYSTQTYKPPYIKPKMVTTSADILKRQPGQTIYGGNVSPAQRAADQLGKDLAEMEDMIVRREEWMAAQALQKGSVRVIGDGVDDTIDFLMKATHKPVLASTAKWDAPTTATPLTDLKAWKRIIAQDCGLVPTDVVMGITAYDKFLACNQVSNSETGLFNLQRVNVGQIEPRSLPNGVTYIGRITEIGVDVWTYEEWFVDADGTETPMIGNDKVLMASRNARATRHYGLIQDLNVNGALKRFPKSWEEEDPSARFVMVQSAPLMVPHQIDAFLCADVL
jgi:hypothetical protein